MILQIWGILVVTTRYIKFPGILILVCNLLCTRMLENFNRKFIEKTWFLASYTRIWGYGKNYYHLRFFWKFSLWSSLALTGLNGSTPPRGPRSVLLLILIALNIWTLPVLRGQLWQGCQTCSIFRGCWDFSWDLFFLGKPWEFLKILFGFNISQSTRISIDVPPKFYRPTHI